MGKASDHVQQAHVAVVVELQGYAQQGFQADAAEGGLGEGQPFGVFVLGRVVRGDGVDGAVPEAVDHRLAVAFGAQRRRQLGEGAVIADGGFVEGKIGRRRIAGDAQPPGLGLAHRFDGGRRRQVGEVKPAPGHFGQADVPLDDDDFRFPGNAGQPQAGRRLA